MFGKKPAQMLDNFEVPIESSEKAAKILGPATPAERFSRARSIAEWGELWAEKGRFWGW
jgi:hypothetical protein